MTTLLGVQSLLQCIQNVSRHLLVWFNWLWCNIWTLFLVIAYVCFRCIHNLSSCWSCVNLLFTKASSIHFRHLVGVIHSDWSWFLLHQNSVNAKYQTIPYPWLVFSEKVKVNTVFIRDSTGVSDSVLILFGGTLIRGEMVVFSLDYIPFSGLMTVI